jgi:hypothetical protein
VLTALISAILFDFRITPAFVCSCIIVKVCCFIYHAAATPEAFESDNELASSSSAGSASLDGDASASVNAPVEYARVSLDDASSLSGDQSFDHDSRIELQSASSFSIRGKVGGNGGMHDDADDESLSESAAHSELAAMPQFSATTRNSPASATITFPARGLAVGTRSQNALAR